MPLPLRLSRYIARVKSASLLRSSVNDHNALLGRRAGIRREQSATIRDRDHCQKADVAPSHRLDRLGSTAMASPGSRTGSKRRTLYRHQPSSASLRPKARCRPGLPPDSRQRARHRGQPSVGGRIARRPMARRPTSRAQASPRPHRSPSTDPAEELACGRDRRSHAGAGRVIERRSIALSASMQGSDGSQTRLSACTAIRPFSPRLERLGLACYLEPATAWTRGISGSGCKRARAASVALALGSGCRQRSCGAILALPIVLVLPARLAEALAQGAIWSSAMGTLDPRWGRRAISREKSRAHAGSIGDGKVT